MGYTPPARQRRNGDSLKQALAAFFAILWLTNARAAEPTCDAITPLPLNPDIRSGQLKNGLEWRVQENPTPTRLAELRLVVKVGSIVEDDDQRGAAHFLEHMAFNGTRSFPDRALTTWLGSIGMTMGADLNAETGFDSTVYKLTIPTEDPEVVRRAFDVLRDWSDGISLKDAAIEAERGVVLAEWRSRLGTAQRVTEQLLPLQFAGSPYVNRLPIGNEDSIRTITPEVLRRFYHDWYRPDQMAVLAVGDFGTFDVVNLIQDRFADLANPTQSRPRTFAEIPPQTRPLVASITDPEARGSMVAIMNQTAGPPDRTCAGFRAELETKLVRLVR